MDEQEGTRAVDETRAYMQMIETMCAEIGGAVDEVPEADLYRRPGPHQNPVGWNYWHLLRIWDYDMNWLARGLGQQGDAWHRGGFSEKSGYNPDGTGMNGMGLGMGHTDAEVDAVNVPLSILHEYRDQLKREAEEYLSNVSEAELGARVSFPNQPDRVATARERIQNAIRNGWLHYGEIRYAKGILGHYDATYPGPSE